MCLSVLPRQADAAPDQSLPQSGGAPAETPDAAEPLELMCLRVHGQEYGLPLDCIQEIRSYQTATALPGQDATVLGVMDLRGQIVALLDLRRLLGLPPAANAAPELRAVVVLVRGRQRLGLVVDEVVDVLPVASGMLRPLPWLAGHAAQRHLRGVVAADARNVLLLDPSPWLDGSARA